MNERAAVDRAEQIEWADAMDTLYGLGCVRDIGKAQQLARECQHPDA